MAVAPIIGIPCKIEAGDAVSFLLSYTSYPASTFAGSFVLSMGTIAPVITAATASGDNFLVTLSSTATAPIVPGNYEWAFYVTQSGNRYTAQNGVISVLPNLAVAASPSTAQNMLTALNAAITALASSKNQSVSFNGQSFTKRDMKSLLEQRVLLQAEVMREQAALARQRGGPDPGRIAIEFVPQENQNFLFYPGPYRP